MQCRIHDTIYWTYTAVIHALLSILYAIYIVWYMVYIVKHQVVLNMQFYAAQSWKALLSWCIPKVHMRMPKPELRSSAYIRCSDGSVEFSATIGYWDVRWFRPALGWNVAVGGGGWKQGAEKMETIPNHKRGKFDTILINELRQTIQSGHFGVIVHW